jgi:hypothetical protein
MAAELVLMDEDFLALLAKVGGLSASQLAVLEAASKARRDAGCVPPSPPIGAKIEAPAPLDDHASIADIEAPRCA